VTAALDIRPLTPQTWDALAALFREGGDPRGCWCQFWRLRARDMSVARVPELEARLRALSESEEPPGLVAFDPDAPTRAIGWLSLGPRSAFEKIVHSKVIPTIDDRPVWSIVCFAVSSSARGRGISRALLERAIEYSRERGAKSLEAYPVRLPGGEARVDSSAAFTGTLEMFEQNGFRVVADRASGPAAATQRVVVRKHL
jgi:GNAT superfamily N-acetyltransferase